MYLSKQASCNDSITFSPKHHVCSCCMAKKIDAMLPVWPFRPLEKPTLGWEVHATLLNQRRGGYPYAPEGLTCDHRPCGPSLKKKIEEGSLNSFAWVCQR